MSVAASIQRSIATSFLFCAATIPRMIDHTRPAMSSSPRASLPRGLDIAEDAAVRISKRSRAIPALVMSLAIGAGPSARADPKPLWEAGLGVGVVAFPDYRGSDQEQVYPLPVPYFIYRGDFFKADRNGVRGEFVKRDWVELSFSANATVPVDSNHDHARFGMPDLRSTLELGPDLEFHLWHSLDSHVKLDAELPLRLPITVEGPPQYLGWDFAPRLDLNLESFSG